MRIAEVKLVWESELSELIRQTYGRPYQLQQQGDMLGQDSMVRVTVPAEPDIPGPASLEEWSSRDAPADMSYVDRLRWDRDYHPGLQELVNDLNARGLMPAGDYVIHVWW